jgi:hypothetical protein
MRSCEVALTTDDAGDVLGCRPHAWPLPRVELETTLLWFEDVYVGLPLRDALELDLQFAAQLVDDVAGLFKISMTRSRKRLDAQIRLDDGGAPMHPPFVIPGCLDNVHRLRAAGRVDGIYWHDDESFLTDFSPR